MCNNLCKAPVQAFFTEQLGMPLTMNPNFEGAGPGGWGNGGFNHCWELALIACILPCILPGILLVALDTSARCAVRPNPRRPADLSCEMIFGQAPPPLAEDTVASQPCMGTCPSALPDRPRCHKLD